MDNKKIALDFSVKAANLSHFLQNEKNEKLISSSLFETSCHLSSIVCSLKNPLLSKSDLSLMKKDASLSSDKLSLLIDMLYSTGYISLAQKDSVSKTLDILKKEINI
jgi:hypothetical protein